VTIVRRWGTFTTIVVAFNVVLVIAVAVILVLTQTRFTDCMANVGKSTSAHPNPPGLAECGSRDESGTAWALLLVPIGILVNLAFLIIWLRRRHARQT
jgi:hypothetical protein